MVKGQKESIKKTSVKTPKTSVSSKKNKISSGTVL
jgi:hypothetical protein